jgi:ParB-like chromosome segregation protein Spo0J
MERGGGSLAAPTNDETRGLKVVLKGLRMINPIPLTAEEEQATSEEESEDESPLKDWKKLVAESEVLAKAKIRKPPIDKPRLSHKLNVCTFSECF